MLSVVCVLQEALVLVRLGLSGDFPVFIRSSITLLPFLFQVFFLFRLFVTSLYVSSSVFPFARFPVCPYRHSFSFSLHSCHFSFITSSSSSLPLTSSSFRFILFFPHFRSLPFHPFFLLYILTPNPTLLFTCFVSFHLSVRFS